ncbi:MAG TPA: hypothetical protein VGP44_06905 [Gemmatimonadales bacterium]|nr:hypothetical protein [Gemmatimonadales bacterium]
MSKLLKLWAAEPVLLVAAVRAVLVAAIGFGLNLSTAQVTSVILAVEALLSLLVTRQAVYAPATVTKIRAKAARRQVAAVAEATGSALSELTDPLIDPEGTP